MSFSYSSLLGLRFLPAMPPSCSSRWLSCLPAFLSLGSRLLPPLSLLRLFPLTGSSPLVLRAFSCLVVFLSLFLLGHFMFSSVYWPSVVLVHLLRNSVESQFLRDGVLPLGRVISYDFSVYGQARWHAPGSCCCSLFTREGLRLCLLFLIPGSVCIGVSPLPRSFGFFLHGFRGVCSGCVPTPYGSGFAGLSALYFCSFSASLFSLCVSSLSFSFLVQERFVLFPS